VFCYPDGSWPHALAVVLSLEMAKLTPRMVAAADITPACFISKFFHATKFFTSHSPYVIIIIIFYKLDFKDEYKLNHMGQNCLCLCIIYASLHYLFSL